jgi:hypothetical protein
MRCEAFYYTNIPASCHLTDSNKAEMPSVQGLLD